MKKSSAKSDSPPSPIFRKRRHVRSEENSAERITPPSTIFRNKRRSLRTEEKKSAEQKTAVGVSLPSQIFHSERQSLEEKNSAEQVTDLMKRGSAKSDYPPSPIFRSKRRFLRSEEKNSTEEITSVSPPSPIFPGKRRPLEEKNSTVRVTAVSEVSLCNTSGASGVQDSQRSYDFNEEEFFGRTKKELEDVVRTADQSSASGNDGGCGGMCAVG